MKKGAVAFLDILGFKGIWRNRQEADVLKLMADVAEVVAREYTQPPPERRWPVSSPPQVTTLSDTVVITMDSDQPHCVLLLAVVLNQVMTYFQRHRLYVRGALGLESIRKWPIPFLVRRSISRAGSAK